jgi:NlpC/P60 family putative phage cell wall peptidase
VIAEARSWLGTRWKHQAARKGVGTDCLGLVAGIALALGLPGAMEAAADERLRGYGREPDYPMALGGLREYMIERQTYEAGDVLYLRVHRGIAPQHFAIVTALGPPYMLHAWAAQRGVVENRIDELWESRIAHIFSYKGVA